MQYHMYGIRYFNTGQYKWYLINDKRCILFIKKDVLILLLFLFFTFGNLQPIKIIILILSRVNHKVGQ